MWGGDYLEARSVDMSSSQHIGTIGGERNPPLERYPLAVADVSTVGFGVYARAPILQRKSRFQTRCGLVQVQFQQLQIKEATERRDIQSHCLKSGEDRRKVSYRRFTAFPTGGIFASSSPAM